ncbi:transposase [Streptomyces sp. NPDC059616]|uniref:transposase n=1 Tax=Streptomyces sp. NPDC059616 TaxID=3346886 RepID=UPI00368A3DE3
MISTGYRRPLYYGGLLPTNNPLHHDQPEDDFTRSANVTVPIRLLDGAHQLLKAPLIVVWDRLSTHISKTMKALVAERDWRTAVPLPGYAPDPNPVEGLWAHIKRSLANLAARTLSELETLLRRRLKRCSTGTASTGAGTSVALPPEVSVARTTVVRIAVPLVLLVNVVLGAAPYGREGQQSPTRDAPRTAFVGPRGVSDPAPTQIFSSGQRILSMLIFSLVVMQFRQYRYCVSNTW